MKKAIFWTILCAIGFVSNGQSSDNTLLWRVSGNNLEKPTYLFGTIHMFCSDDIQLSDSLKSAINACDKVYLELDMNNIFEMLQAMGKMKMRNDTLLSDLLTASEYDKVKTFFSTKKLPLPFSLLETYKPLLTASLLMESTIDCEKVQSMEQLIMNEAKRSRKSIKGLETMMYQLSIFDSIPYKIQAKQLFDFVDDYKENSKSGKSDYDELAKAYKLQQLDRLEEISNKDDELISNFSNILLYNRNINWVGQLKMLMKNNALVVAVGAGHLPGKKGVLNLLREAGYNVEPVENKMSKLKEVEL